MGERYLKAFFFFNIIMPNLISTFNGKLYSSIDLRQCKQLLCHNELQNSIGRLFSTVWCTLQHKQCCVSLVKSNCQEKNSGIHKVLRRTHSLSSNRHVYLKKATGCKSQDSQQERSQEPHVWINKLCKLTSAIQ